MFTVSDIIHLIQYYYHTSSYDNASADVETFRLESLRGKYHLLALLCDSSTPCSDIERSLGVATPPLIHEHPNSSLYDAAQRLIQTHARRLPLLDNDSETGHQVIVSVLTQYRLLKFIAINVMSPLSCRHLPHLATVLSGYSSPPSSSPQAWHRHLCAA
jgi:5'-AMP-activated protein kinase regulatory gamma subunit